MKWIMSGPSRFIQMGALMLAAASLTIPAEAGASAADVEVLERTGKAFSRVAQRAIPAVVSVRVEKAVDVRGRYHQTNPYDAYGDEFLRRFFGYGQPDTRQYRQEGQGSGFIVSEDGYILTNHHIVGDVDDIIVTLNDGRELEGTLVGTDPQSEVAVIKVEASDLPVIALGDSSDLEIGEWVIAVGNPFGLSATLTVGVVSAKGRHIGLTDEVDHYGRLVSQGYEDFIQTDAAINPGNSGGPLLNIKGEAVGINTAIFSRSGGYMGIGFAIPMNMARGIKDQLVKSGKIERGYIGIYIQDIDGDLAAAFELDEPKGILIADVGEKSAGEKAGLERGDVILKLDDEDVDNVNRFRSKVASKAPGTEVNLRILRNGDARVIPVVIGLLDGAPGVTSVTDLHSRIGLRVEELSPSVARQMGYEVGAGVLVAEVDSDSPASRAGLRPGQLISGVNRALVSNVGEYERELAKSNAQDAVLLLVSDGRGSRFVALSIE